MRQQVLIAAAVLLLVGTALADKPRPDVLPIDRFGEKTKDTKKVHMQLTMEMHQANEHFVFDATGTLDLWADAEKGRYEALVIFQVISQDEAMFPNRIETSQLFTPESAATWMAEEDGSIGFAREDEDKATTPGKPFYDRDLGPLVFFVDAMFGYPGLKNHAMLKPTDSPLPDEDDDLQWFELKDVPEDKDSPFREALWAGSRVTSTVVGFSPDTGWPMKLVFRGEGTTATLRMQAIDLEPDLTGAFTLPPEVKEAMTDEPDF